MKQLVWLRRQPLKHSRRRWVTCSQCHYGTLNEEKHLQGWEESITAPRAYRCDSCSEAAA